MDIVSLLIIVALLAAVFMLVSAKDGGEHIPGPPGFPLIGHSHLLLANWDNLLDYLCELNAQYGPVFSMKLLGQGRFTFVSDPKDVEYMLKTNFSNFTKGDEFHSRLKDLLGNGIFNTDGEQWKTQRKTAAMIFNVNNFRDNMMAVFLDHSKQVKDLLFNLEDGEKVDMQQIFYSFTLDCIGEIAFGDNIDSLHKDTPFAKAFDYAQQNANQRFFVPAWQFAFHLTGQAAKCKAAIKQLDSYAYKVIAKRREEAAQQKEGEEDGRADLVSLFMSRKLEDGSECDDKYLRDVIMNFMIAGRDTTAQNLSWTFYLLSQNPDAMATLQQHVDETFQGQLPTYDQIKNFKYGQAVVSESLRLYPSVPKDGKWVNQPDTLPSGVSIPGNSWLAYMPYVMGRMTSLWGPDAASFKPERWLDKQKPNPFLFVAFQAGPRVCLGQNMATIEATTLLTILVQHFSFELLPNQHVHYQQNLTLPMKNPLYMTVKKRSAKC